VSIESVIGLGKIKVKEDFKSVFTWHTQHFSKFPNYNVSPVYAHKKLKLISLI